MQCFSRMTGDQGQPEFIVESLESYFINQCFFYFLPNH